MVYVTHQQAQQSTVCPLCGVVPWRDGLKTLRLFPTNHVSLGESHLVYLCPICFARLLSVPESKRWLYYLELYYKHQLGQTTEVKVKHENHGLYKGRKK